MYIQVRYKSLTSVLTIDKQLLKTNSDVFFISTYLPPPNSPFYNDTDSVEVQRLAEFLVTNNLTDKLVVICGKHISKSTRLN